jgi:homoserine dehydrogenase
MIKIAINGGGRIGRQVFKNIEESHPELFLTLDSVFNFISSNQTLSKDNLENLESLIVIRILHRLGYIANILDLKEYIESDNINELVLSSIQPKRTIINKHINKALKESHL